MVLRKETRDKIVAQSLQEKTFAYTHKQSKLNNWTKNEEMYYGKKIVSADSRANVELGRVQEFVHTLLSKIDNPLTFKFHKRKFSQLIRIQRLNSLREYDSQRDFWDLKDIVGKKQAIIYGRAIFSYHATNNYAPHLENVDVYNFLIDPSAGGIDIEQARFMGRFGVMKSRQDLETGVKKGTYIKTEVKELLDGAGNNSEKTQMDLDKRVREQATGITETSTEISDTDKFRFWEWYTTYNGNRYYLLITDGGKCIRVEKLEDLFATDVWPFWTYAAFPDLTEFWTPSYVDYVREIFMAQTVSINQMLDNAERVNKPQKIIDVGAVEDLAELKYRKDGVIRALPGTRVNEAVKLLEVPSIETPITVFNVLESIQEKSMGVSASEKGMADTDGRATIYEGNRQAAGDRYGLLNKSYSFGYRRFAMLYENEVRDKLNKKIAVDILGPEGIEIQNISKRDIFRGDESFAVLIEASDAEMQISNEKKRTMFAFLSANMQNSLVNQKKSTELQAQTAGLQPQEIRELLDTSEFGDENVMSEADRDIEDIMDGKTIQPNRIANAAYKQRLVNYAQDNMEHMKDEQIVRLMMYIESLDDIILQNTMRQADEQAARSLEQQEGPEAGKLRAPGPAQPLQDVIQQNT